MFNISTLVLLLIPVKWLHISTMLMPKLLIPSKKLDKSIEKSADLTINIQTHKQCFRNDYSNGFGAQDIWVKL